eukprot:g10212.t1
MDSARTVSFLELIPILPDDFWCGAGQLRCEFSGRPPVEFFFEHKFKISFQNKTRKHADLLCLRMSAVVCGGMADNEPREEPEEAEGKVPEQKQPEDPEVRVLAEAVGAMRVGLITAENIPKELGVLPTPLYYIGFFVPINQVFPWDQAFVLNWAKKLV